MSRSPGSRIPGIPEIPDFPVSRGSPRKPRFPRKSRILGSRGAPKPPFSGVFGTRKRGVPPLIGGISEPEYHIISRTPPGFPGPRPLSPPQNSVFSGFFRCFSEPENPGFPGISGFWGSKSRILAFPGGDPRNRDFWARVWEIPE